MAKAKPKAKTKTTKPAPAKKPPVKAAKAAKLPKPKAKAPAVTETADVVDEAPRAERGVAALACAQCDATIDAGALRIVLAAGEALHPGCTFGWTLDHLADNSATADWMAQLMRRSQLTPDDRAELLDELGAPSA